MWLYRQQPQEIDYILYRLLAEDSLRGPHNHGTYVNGHSIRRDK